MPALLDEEDYKRAAETLGVSVPAIKAVAKVEANGSGFLPSGQPKILFEAHYFSRLTKGRYDNLFPEISSPKWNRKLYKGGQAEHDRLIQAVQLNREAALKSASWGKFQIMGANYAACGYKKLQDFINDMYASEGKQLDAFCGFVKSDPLMLSALRARNWSTFARRYNGPAYAENQYDKKLRAAYESFGGRA